MGLTVTADEIWTAPMDARELLIARGWMRCRLLVADAVREDLAGIEDEERSPRAVVLGDLGEHFTYERLNGAFRALLDGAELVALGRNRYFRSGDGLVLDVGAFAAALEYASGREALVVGKPSREFFRTALDSLGVPSEEAVMVGDDVEFDVGGAQQEWGQTPISTRTWPELHWSWNSGSVPDFAVIASLAEITGLLAS